MGYTAASYDPFFAPDEELLQRQYDFVLCIEVAEHFFAPSIEFNRLHQLLRSDGWLALMTKLVTAEQSLETWWYTKDPTHVSLYSRHTIDWIQKKWGWTLHSESNDVHLFHKA
jgi:cyclopropane fatty-acyl-phospholipid synthase-like methyltransferase